MTTSTWLTQLGAIQTAFSVGLRDGKSPRSMGLSGTTASQNRMLARVALAVRYDRAAFHGYADLTAAAYSSLIGLFLAWSAFEQVAASTGLVHADGRLSPERIDDVFRRCDVPTEVSEWKGIAPLMGVLAELTTNGKLRKQLRDAADGHPLRLRVLMSGLRHAFAHGVLSANAGGVNPRRLQRACDALRRVLIHVQLSHLDAVTSFRTNP